MKKLLFSLMALGLSLSSYAYDKIVVISDLDDTIRQVNVAELEEAALRVLAERSSTKEIPRFDGLQKVYSDIHQNNEVKFYYLSASYPFIYNAQEWIEINEFPAGIAKQRSRSDEFDSGVFKKRILEEIIDENNSDETLFLFFGDNGEHDPESYNHVVSKKDIGDQSMIFIRDVVSDANFKMADSRDLYPGTHYFFTEKNLIETPLVEFLSYATIDELEKQTLADIPRFMVDNLDERYEDNVCDEIPYWQFRRKMKCSWFSGNKAREMIRSFLND